MTALCPACRGVGRRAVQGPRRYQAARPASIIVCEPCNGSGRHPYAPPLILCLWLVLRITANNLLP
jgi:hypothetical protein